MLFSLRHLRLLLGLMWMLTPNSSSTSAAPHLLEADLFPCFATGTPAAEIMIDEVVEMFYDFTRDENHSILISSHIVSDLEKLCDYVAFLHKGKLLLCEEKDALAAEYGLLRCPRERLAELDPAAVLTRRDTPYYAEAVVRRDGVPAGTEVMPVGIEDIFVAMVKEDRS